MPVLILSFKSLFTEISIGESFFLQNIGDAIREKSNKNSQYIFIKRPPISNQNRSLHILRSAFFFLSFFYRKYWHQYQICSCIKEGLVT